MSTLICGSIAYDTIMVFRDSFAKHILPEHVHVLNVSFLVPEMRREFGGCGGNIAYNLQLLGGEPMLMGTVGEDFDPYREWFGKWGVPLDHVKVIPGTHTAQAFITTDLEDNQITAFHPGAMAHSHDNAVADASGVTLGIVAPDGRDGMMSHASQFAAAGIPFILDPGQNLILFDGDEIKAFLDQASYVVVNDYEAQVMQDRTGLDVDSIASRVDAFIVTLGAQGSRIHAGGDVIEIPPARTGRQIDPTGCGDAYRSGLLYGLEKGLDWSTAGCLASLMGAIKIEVHGTQNHAPDRNEIESRFKDSFGYAVPLD